MTGHIPQVQDHTDSKTLRGNSNSGTIQVVLDRLESTLFPLYLMNRTAIRLVQITMYVHIYCYKVHFLAPNI